MNDSAEVVDLELQIASESESLPEASEFIRWIDAALPTHQQPTEIVIRIVDEQEGTELNQTYRNKRGATNVLSFPFDAPPQVSMNLLGDLVICAPVIAREADEQSKPLDAHWAHMTVHGVLHLIGYDHQTEEQAKEMESLEKTVLTSLGYENPYKDDV